jgi:hypothetical protein
VVAAFLVLFVHRRGGAGGESQYIPSSDVAPAGGAFAPAAATATDDDIPF